MALSITVNGAGTFTASMEEGPVSFSASLGAIGPKGDTGATGATGPGVAAGGTTGQILVKTTNADYATGWIDNAARSVFISGRNNTGSTIAKGAVVYLSGATGNKATIALAQANSEATSDRTIGITKAEVANGADGDVVISGAIENIDTSAFAAGTVVYLSATVAGGLTSTLPTQPNHGVVVGIVTRSNANNGSIEVTVQNYQELKELSDVLVSSPSNGQVLTYDSGLWKNLAIPTPDLSAYAILGGAGNVFTAIQLVNVDNVKNALSVRQAGSGHAIAVEDAAFPWTERFSVDKAGNVVAKTAEIVTAPAAGDSSSKVPTTAWVQTEASAYLSKAGNLSGLASVSTARTNLGLGTMATETASDYLTKAGNLSGLASNATARTNLDVYSKSESDALVPSASTTVAGKVELATDAEAITGTSATLVPSLAADLASQLSTKVWSPGVTNLSTATSGTGANAGSTITALNGRLVAPNASTVGYATRAFTLWSPSNSVNAGLNYGLRSGFSVRMHLTNWTTTLTDVVWRAVFGRMAANVPVPGPLTARAFGVQFNFATSVLSIIAHDGTTLTTTNLTWSPVNFRTYEITCIHDGAGTVSVYIDGSLIGTGTGAPTTTSTTSRAWWQIEIENTSTSAPANTDIYFANPKVLLLNG